MHEEEFVISFPSTWGEPPLQNTPNPIKRFDRIWGVCPAEADTYIP
jgi:hypothetical protein